ncbi:hypothetical protein BMI76_08955 [Streptococcus sp. 'caviae']|nr:hypothetical protein BMI76_08955 [Streptococcus sp. 'caviae']
MDADNLAQIQGQGWVGAIAGGVTGVLAGAKAGGAAALPVMCVPGFGWATEAGVVATSAIAGAVLGAGVGYNTPL